MGKQKYNGFLFRYKGCKFVSSASGSMVVQFYCRFAARFFAYFAPNAVEANFTHAIQIKAKSVRNGRTGARDPHCIQILCSFFKLD